ncbi:MAG: hypothetical protein JW818_00815 [Pirellulales bacterium]|nr:hypothetical protein [Pirellulales bacterium]
MRRSTILLLAALSLTVLTGSGRAWGQESAAPKFVRADFGLGGEFKLGVWTPVRLTIRGGTETLRGTVTLTVPDGDGVPSEVSTPPDRPCLILPGNDTPVFLCARIGRSEASPVAKLIVNGRVVTQKEFTPNATDAELRCPQGLGAAQRWFLEIGPTKIGVGDAVKRLPSDSGLEPVVTRLTDVEQMPTRWYGYEGVEAIVISTSKLELLRKLSSGNNARLDALERWIEMGGRLVLAVGANGSEIFDEQGPLARFAPGKLATMEPLKRTIALESYADSRVPVPNQGKAMQVPCFKDVQGTIEAEEPGLPLVVRTQRGFGEIVFIAADLDRAPWSRWPSRSALIARLLGLPTKAPDDGQSSTGGAFMGEGYEDISGQLRSCLDRFKGVRPVSFGAVVAGILVYILLIGPGDYFLLRKLKRMEWTWITFPTVVVVFCVATYWLAYELKGRQLRVNQVDVVDVDTQTGLVRGTTWANIFSPRMETYNLSLRPTEALGEQPEGQSEVLVSWLGLPGNGLGGMQSSGGSTIQWRRGYRFTPSLDAMDGCPIQVWSTKSVTGRYRLHWEGRPRADLRQVDELPVGRVANPFDFPLEDCLLVYDRWAYKLGTLEPGASVAIENERNRVHLQTLLTDRTLAVDPNSQHFQRITPYRSSSNDVDVVLREMMFYEASGGRKYAQLANAYQEFVDLSDLLDENHAILVGRAPKTASAGATLVRDGQPLGNADNQQITVFRFLFPVKTEKPTSPRR